jgi:hypothetical protein
MFDWKLVLFWVFAMAVGVVGWWAMLVWFGMASAVLALGVLGLAMSAGTLIRHRPQPRDVTVARRARPRER